MPRLTIIFFLLLTSCTGKYYISDKWKVKIDISGVDYVILESEQEDLVLKHQYLQVQIPAIRLEGNNLPAEIRVFDGSVMGQNMGVSKIFDSLYATFLNQFEVLDSSTHPHDFGRLYSFVVESRTDHLLPSDKIRYVYHYYQTRIGEHDYLIATRGTFGMLRQLDAHLEDFMSRIEPL